MSSTEKKKVPGLMRFWQVYYSIIVVLNLVSLMFITTSRTPFEFNDYLSLLYVVYAGVVLWLLWSRKKVARYVIPAFALAYLVIGVVGNFVISGFVWDFNYLSDNGRAVEIIAALYFFFSKKVRTVLTEDFSATPESERGTESDLFRPKEFLFWRNILLYFMVFAVVGHWLELGYNTFLRYFANQYDPNSGIWSDYLYPYNVYGVGAVACIILLYPLKDFLSKKISSVPIVLALSFAFNAAVCTLIEFIMGMMVNQPDANGVFPLWDYTDLPFNFMGQICLQNALAFGVAATFMVWVAFPTIERLIRSISRDAMNIISVVIIVIYLVLSALYFFDFQLPTL